MIISSYENLCKLIQDDNDYASYRHAELIFYFQSWMVYSYQCATSSEWDFNLDSFLSSISRSEYDNEEQKDVISKIILDTSTPFARLSDNLRSKVIRENIIQPVYKVREMNSHSLKWLSRQAGLTIKEKIANANMSIMSVRQRHSYDTGENRLLLEFLRQLVYFIDVKSESFPKYRTSEDERLFALKAFNLVKAPDFAEVQRWQNLPPNNTLLSDINYRQIWNAWCELKDIDELVELDSLSIDSNIAKVFFILLLSEINKYYLFPQQPIIFDYADRLIELPKNNICGVSNNGNKIYLNISKDGFIKVTHDSREIVISFKDRQWQLTGLANDIEQMEYQPQLLPEMARKVVEQICESSEPLYYINGNIEEVKSSSSIIDPFHVRPIYSTEPDHVNELGIRLLIQTHIVSNIDGSSHSYAVPCERSNAIEINHNIDTYSMLSSLEDDNSLHVTELTKLLHDYLVSSQLVFLFPDLLNDFQISMLHKALRLSYSNVIQFPRSMGLVFSYMQSEQFQKEFTLGDSILVVDLVDDSVSITLIESCFNDKLQVDLPTYGGLSWIRHPTSSSSLSYSQLKNLIAHASSDKEATCLELYKVLGVTGLKSECNRLTFFDNEHSFALSLKSGHIDISKQIDDFLTNYAHIICESNVHILSMCSVLQYSGRYTLQNVSYEDAIQGYRFYESLQTQTNQVLWEDHLPELAIKLLYGKFNLIEDQTVQPTLNKDVMIPIDRVFTLSKGKKEYRFRLVSSNLSKGINYEAVVRNPAFPLQRDEDCRLVMTYRYGAEEPFALIFEPKERTAAFLEAKVSWEVIQEFDYKNLPVPNPMKRIPWDELRRFKNNNRVTDLIFGREPYNEGAIYFLEKMSSKYYVTDISDSSRIVSTNNREIVASCSIDGKDYNILFKDSNIEYNTKKTYFNINCDCILKQLKVISFDIAPVEDDDRFLVDLKEYNRGNIWGTDRNGQHICIIDDAFINNESIKIGFNEKNFANQNDFNTGVHKVSFSLKENRQNKDIYWAYNIHNEELGAYEENYSYTAINIRSGDSISTEPITRRAVYVFHQVFAGGNYPLKGEAPDELVTALENAKEELVQMYKACHTSYLRNNILQIMSLCGPVFSNFIFTQINSALKQTGQNKTNINILRACGPALGDGTDSRVKSILAKLSGITSNDPMSPFIYLLSGAVWGHPDFVINADSNILLKFFDNSVKYLKHICSVKQYEAWDKIETHNTIACLSYILGVFRLREINDPEINWRLSLNNPVMQELYNYLETLFNEVKSERLTIKCFLQLDVASKTGIYKDIPDLLYALLVYVSGDAGAADIKIVGLSLDELES